MPGRSCAKAERSKETPRNRERIKQILNEALRSEFPTDTVDVSGGYRDNIRVLVVSRQFDDMNEEEKQDYLWRLIDATDLTDLEKALVSLLLPLSPAQIK